MAKRKRLTGIANSLLGTFVSRNNDIGGYWGIGVLRQYASRKNLADVYIELAGQTEDRTPESPVKNIEEVYKGWLLSSLAKVGVDYGQLKGVEIQLRFSTFEEFPDAIRDTRGDPYLCSVIITNKEDIKYSASILGVCAPHDPNKERRRA